MSAIEKLFPTSLQERSFQLKAEPGALIGFAGPHVIEQTIGEKLPEGFQRSEFQLQHGFVDKAVPRTEMKAVLAQILQLHTQGRKCR